MISVLVDGYSLLEGSRQRGIGTFLRRILTPLCQEPDLAIQLLGDPGDDVPSAIRRIPLRRPVPARFSNAVHDLLLPAAVTKNAGDVFYSPAQHPPRYCRVPWVQTLHDLIPLTRPDPVLAKDRKRWMRVGPRLRGAAAVVAVSRFTADEAIRHLGLDPRRLHVISHGVDHRTFRPAALPAVEVPYVLHVAAWGPHKGFSEALAVIAKLAELGLPHRLLLAGPQDSWMLGQVRATIASSPRPDRVEVLGYVEDLASLYRGATALLVTSRCEGFGFPALEAMACGTPVVAFANSSLPEVVGDGGLLVGDGNVDAMVKAVRELAEDEERRSELAARGIAHASRFRWEDAAAAYANLLREVSEAG